MHQVMTFRLRHYHSSGMSYSIGNRPLRVVMSTVPLSSTAMFTVNHAHDLLKEHAGNFRKPRSPGDLWVVCMLEFMEEVSLAHLASRFDPDA